LSGVVATPKACGSRDEAAALFSAKTGVAVFNCEILATKLAPCSPINSVLSLRLLAGAVGEDMHGLIKHVRQY
jgi:hypothetical protein